MYLGYITIFLDGTNTLAFLWILCIYQIVGNDYQMESLGCLRHFETILPWSKNQTSLKFYARSLSLWKFKTVKKIPSKIINMAFTVWKWRPFVVLVTWFLVIYNIAVKFNYSTLTRRGSATIWIMSNCKHRVISILLIKTSNF